MIQEFVNLYMQNKHKLEAKYLENHPESYTELVKNVIELLHDPEEHGTPDPDNIIEINHGDYQGTLVYVIPSDSYQPGDYWYVKIAYGSCSGCDMLDWIKSKEFYEVPNEQQVKDYMTLSLHVVQAIRSMDVETNADI